MLYRIDFQMRSPWYGGPQEWYYWSNIWYAEAAEPVDLFQVWDTLSIIQNNTKIEETKFDYRLTREWPSGIVHQQVPFTTQPPNTRTGPAAGLSNVFRVDMYRGGRHVSYKLFRSPLREQDMDGYKLSTEAYTRLSGVASYMQNDFSELRAGDGLPVDSVVASPLVHGWILRHGTRRRDRRRLPI